MNKKLSLIIMLLFLIMMTACSKKIVEDTPEKIVIYFFTDQGCPSCDVQTEYMKILAERYNDIEIKTYDISEQRNKKLLLELAEAYNENIITAPVTFIAEETIVGFGNEQTTGQIIENIIKQCRITKCKNPRDVRIEYT